MDGLLENIDRLHTIERAGKNWYILVGCVRITVNAYSYTIITAHSRERDLGGKAGENFGVFGAKMGKNREI